MNCVVERKHAEEIVDSPSKTVALPFGVNLTTDPKKARITGERISIYCEGGNENREQDSRNNNNYNNNNNKNNNNSNREDDDDNDIDSEIEAIRPMFVPYQRIPIPFGPVMQQYPLTHMPQRMLPPMPVQQQTQIVRQLPPPFQQQQQFRPPQRMMPPQQMMPPRPDLPQQIQHHMMMMQELPQQVQHNQYQQQSQQQSQQQLQHQQQSQQEQQQQQQPQQQQTVRIHVQEMPFHEIHMADDVPVQIPTQQQELPHFQVAFFFS